MDANRFDQVARRLATAHDRRASLRGLLAATLALAGQRLFPGEATARRRTRRVVAEGPCGNGKPKKNRCKKHRQCCTGYCHKKKRCRCRKLNQSCTEDRNCCPDTTGRTCQDGVCQPQAICIPAGDTCELTDLCCDQTTCAGLDGVHGRTCQDCNAPLTAAGEFCGPDAGNQCCNGDPDAFVGQLAGGGALVCLDGVDCGTSCDDDSDCGSDEVCIRIVAGSGCCNNASRNICATLAP